LATPSYASRVTRSPQTGLITQINESLINAPLFKTEGFDLALDYRKDTPCGVFDLYAMGTRISLEDRQLAFDVPSANYVGWPDESGESRYKANGTLSWAYQHWTLAWTTTWFGSYHVNGTPGDPTAENPTIQQAQGAATIPSQIYHQLYASYAFGKDNHAAMGLLSNLKVQVTIKNIFNVYPPVDIYEAPFYYSQYGNLNLREVYLSARKDF